MATNQQNVMQLHRSQMTPLMENVSMNSQIAQSPGDIPVTDITGTVNVGRGEFGSPEYPQILPDNPTFTVPANPLLPPEYNEVLDYNSVQYINGFMRTQIGKFVRVQQLVGSNIIEDYDGFLIGVGINYIILQDYSSPNIRVLDIYGIKNMYVYYAEVQNPITRT